jgi:hypothetical protein
MKKGALCIANPSLQNKIDNGSPVFFLNIRVPILVHDNVLMLSGQANKDEMYRYSWHQGSA